MSSPLPSISLHFVAMESGRELRTPQEGTSEQITGIQKTLGFARTSGQDYEVALCSLFFLRALRMTRDFFLICNHAVYDKFDDVVLFYRLKADRDHKYRAIFLQAKHKDRYTEKWLTKSNPFRLNEYLESFKKIRNVLEHSARIYNHTIELHEISLVLYTNTGCTIGNAAVDVTNLPQVQHLQDFLNTRGRLLQIPEAQRLDLPQGPDTSAFLGHLLLCTEQMNVKKIDEFLEQELCKVLRLSSRDIGRKLNSELRRVVKAWWSEGTGRYLTADSQEWIKVLEMQTTRLNGDTLTIDRHLNLGFTEVALQELNDLHRRREMIWLSVRDRYQANAVRARLLRAQRNSLVVGVRFLVGHWEEVEALWRKGVCPTLALVVSGSSREEESLLLQRLQLAVQRDSDKHLVVISKGTPANVGWDVVQPSATWSALDAETQGRLLSVRVELQGKVSSLRDILGYHVSDVMTDQVIDSLSLCETAIKVGQTMAAPLEFYVPRCLQRSSSTTVEFWTLQNTDTLIFPNNLICIPESVKTLSPSDLKRTDKIEGLMVVRGVSIDSQIRHLCSRFRVRAIEGEIRSEGFTGDVTEFIPFTWICQEKFVVVEGLPGVGKSSFVTAMCDSVKQQFPESWVLRIDMGKQSDYIKTRNFMTSSDVHDFLLKGLPLEPRSLERDLLKHSLSVSGNVFLFLDAFDEISPDFTARCCDLLKGIVQKVRFRQMVVTTRPVTTRVVQEALQTEAFTLPVFSREEQTTFLERFSVARGKNVDRKLMTFLRQSAGPVIENPLLCKMAAEVLMFRQEQIMLKCENPWRRVLLYKLFVAQNIKNRLAEKYALESSVPGMDKLLQSIQQKHLQNLQTLAVRKLMPTEMLSNVYLSEEVPEEKFGLVVNYGETVDFEHQTFAEYFLGCWLFRHRREFPLRLLGDVLFRDDFQFVAATLSWSLFEECPLHVAVAQGNENTVRASLSSWTTDRGGRSALHVAAMTEGNNTHIWELLVDKRKDLNKKDLFGRRAVDYAQVSTNWEFVDLMRENEALLRELKFATDVNAAKEVLIHAIRKDLSSLCRHILGLHKEIFSDRFDARGNTLLHIAAANNSTAVISHLKEMDSALNIKNSKGQTPLHVASRHGHLEAVRLLIGKGADVNIKAKYGYTALMLADSQDHLNVVKLLIEKGIDINTKNDYGSTTLTLASREGHLGVVRILIENRVETNVKNKYGSTALTLAAREGHLQIVKLLIDNRADPNIENDNGSTALILAAGGGHLEVVKLLIQSGADPHTKNKYGETALNLAARQGHLEVFQLLQVDTNIKIKYGATTFTLEAFLRELEVVNVLIENGADPNIKKYFGSKELTLAASEGHLETLKFIIQNGVDPNIKNINEETALMIAASKGYLEVVEFLILNGADPRITNKYGSTCLTLAASKGHHETVKLLIENGVDPQIKNKYGSTAMTLAASEGHLEVVKLLIENRIDPDVKNKYGSTALALAASKGHLEVVQLLIEEGAESHVKNNNGSTALMLGASEGHLETVKLLIAKGSSPNVKNKYGETALTLAANKGHLGVVQLLIEKGADTNLKNDYGSTAMILAAGERHLEVIKLLLESGADPNIKNDLGTTALTLAASRGHLEIVRLVIERGIYGNVKNDYVSTALTWAAGRGHRDVVALLIENGANTNNTNDCGSTALTLAAGEGHLEVIQLLIESGADPNIKNKYGETALWFAVCFHHLEVVKLLIDSGADTDIKDGYGSTALMLASSEGHLEVVMLLIEKGADRNTKNDYGSTALTLAAREGHVEIVKILLDNGVDPNIKNKYGETALMLASREGHLEVVKLLLQIGRDPNVKNKYGETALTLAVSKGHLKVVTLLVDTGADPNIKTNNGSSALTLAAFKGHLEVVTLLVQNGADPDIKNEYGVTSLWLAACKGHMEIVKLLIDSGAHTGIKDCYGSTALMLASSEGHLEVVRTLIDNGADGNKKNKYRFTALMLAGSEGHLEIVKLLVGKGADPNVQNNYGETALTLAVREGHLDVAKLLIENGADPLPNTRRC